MESVRALRLRALGRLRTADVPHCRVSHISKEAHAQTLPRLP